jgi:hypothetical protein
MLWRRTHCPTLYSAPRSRRRGPRSAASSAQLVSKTTPECRRLVSISSAADVPGPATAAHVTNRAHVESTGRTSSLHGGERRREGCGGRLDRLGESDRQGSVAFEYVARIHDSEPDDATRLWRVADHVTLRRFLALTGLRLANMQVEDIPLGVIGGMGSCRASRSRGRRRCGSFADSSLASRALSASRLSEWGMSRALRLGWRNRWHSLASDLTRGIRIRRDS